MQITAEIKGLKELQGTLQRLDNRIPIWLAGALNDATKSIKKEIIDETPVGATGKLQKSWRIEKATKEDLTARVGTHFVPHYAPDVEYGTRPHKISGKVLKGWARVKLGNAKLAYAVARKIAKSGTRPQKPFDKGTNNTQGILNKAMNHFAEKVESEWK